MNVRIFYFYGIYTSLTIETPASARAGTPSLGVRFSFLTHFSSLVSFLNFSALQQCSQCTCTRLRTAVRLFIMKKTRLQAKPSRANMRVGSKFVKGPSQNSNETCHAPECRSLTCRCTASGTNTARSSSFDRPRYASDRLPHSAHRTWQKRIANTRKG